jgi:hypothetical protein
VQGPLGRVGVGDREVDDDCVHGVLSVSVVDGGGVAKPGHRLAIVGREVNGGMYGTMRQDRLQRRDVHFGVGADGIAASRMLERCARARFSRPPRLAIDTIVVPLESTVACIRENVVSGFRS